MKAGDLVHCLAGNLDNGRGVGAIGHIKSIAGNEAFVADKYGRAETWSGWFRILDLKVIAEYEPERDHEGRTTQDRYDDDCIEQYGSISLEDKYGF